MKLAFGASRAEATAEAVRAAAAAALGPTLQQLSGMGLVALPSVMAGELLAGAPPSQVSTQCGL